MLIPRRYLAGVVNACAFALGGRGCRGAAAAVGGGGNRGRAAGADPTAAMGGMARARIAFVTTSAPGLPLGLSQRSQGPQQQQPRRSRQRGIRSLSAVVRIPEDRLEFSFTRSGGAGGQNVNKVNTKVEIRFNVDEADWMPVEVRERLKEQQSNKVNKAGDLITTSSEYRTQKQNRMDAMKKLRDAVEQAYIVPKERSMREGRGKIGKERMLKDKKRRSETKANRRKPTDW